jgi:hypothetical protein
MNEMKRKFERAQNQMKFRADNKIHSVSNYLLYKVKMGNPKE